jgi:hypothetical protein
MQSNTLMSIFLSVDGQIHTFVSSLLMFHPINALCSIPSHELICLLLLIDGQINGAIYLCPILSLIMDGFPFFNFFITLTLIGWATVLD